LTAGTSQVTGGGLRLRPGRPQDAVALTELALRSKAHWGYDDAFMAACRAELTLTAGQISARRTVVAEESGTGTPAGFVTLEGEPPHGVLGMLFVAPDAMGRGAGRLLYGHALREAARLGFTRIAIDADPNAEPFYRAMGAVTVGRVPSGSVPGRTLPLMRADVPATGTFAAPDGTVLTYHLRGEGEPLLVLPGGPMRASEYLGDLGGLTAHRRLVLLDLRGSGESQLPADPGTYRCDRQVADVEALRAHLGLAGADLLTHSAGAALALLYTARYPERVRSLTLVAPSLQALGVEFTEEHRRQALAARAGEPWQPAAAAAMDAVFAGRAADEDWEALTPLAYGRWDAAAQAHAAADVRQRDEAAAGSYQNPAAFDPAATRAALAAFTGPVLLMAGELDGGPRPEVAAEAAGFFRHGRSVVQPGGGHFPWLDDRAWFSGTVGTFLR
jgi:pimeloyl-ACP methyl ester carboxylesterase/GNAT superfamily N-acetyltransferase